MTEEALAHEYIRVGTKILDLIIDECSEKIKDKGLQIVFAEAVLKYTLIATSLAKEVVEV